MKERYETFTLLINRISRNVRKLKNQEMAEYGLRSAHISCLYALHSTDALTATDLCERCEEDKATISRALEYLETNGYLTCPSNSGKRYKAPLLLTEKGTEVAGKIADKINGILNEVSDSLTGEERLAFYRSLATISDRLDAVVKHHENKDIKP